MAVTEAEFGLREVLGRIWQAKARAGLIAVVTLGLFVAAAFIMSPWYRAQLVMVAASSESRNSLGALGSLGGLASIAGINLGALDGKESEEALAVLQSRAFTEQFIRDRNLLPVLYARRWDAARKTWKDPDDEPTMAMASRYFATLRAVNQDAKTGLVTLSIDWRSPEVAADWANDLVSRLNNVMRVRTTHRTDAYIEYLEKELERTTTVETRNAMSRIMETQITQRMLARVTTEYSFRVVDSALPPDPKRPIRPQRVLMAVLGGIFGLIFGCLYALTFPPKSRSDAGSAP